MCSSDQCVTVTTLSNDDDVNKSEFLIRENGMFRTKLHFHSNVEAKVKFQKAHVGFSLEARNN